MSKYKRIRRKFIRNGKYWRERSVQAEAAKQAANQKTFAEIEKIYRNAQKELDAEIDKWYARIALNNDISLADAHKLLYADQLEEFHWDVKEYIHKCKIAGIYGGKWSKQLENASAKVHISRLEALKIRTQQSLEMLYAKEHNMLKNAFSDAYKTGYYQSFFEFHKAAGIGFDIGTVDNNALEKLLYKPWAADGRNFSERIWGNKYQLVDTLHKELTQHIMLGQSVEKTADRIARDVVKRGAPALDVHNSVKENLRKAKMNARRLVQTESAYFHSMGQKQMFDDLDVDKYEYVATIDSRTSDICAAMNGKIFDMKDYETGVNAPPLHVNCRSTTAPYFDDEYELELEADKELYELPAGTSYNDWKNAFVAGGDKSGFKKLQENGLTNSTESGKIKSISDLKRIVGEHSIVNDAMNVNPDFSKGGEYAANCGYCVVAYELRRRGYDVIANPSSGVKGREIISMFDKFEPLHSTEKTKEAIINDIISNVKSWGDNARGTVWVQLGHGAGHYFSIEYNGEDVLFIDPQNYTYDAIHWFDDADLNNIIFGRLDNLELTKYVVNAVANKG